ncbi:MAG: hypothetical protein ACI94Y_002554, partial [Maribacter sp.]
MPAFFALLASKNPALLSCIVYLFLIPCWLLDAILYINNS